MTLSPPLLTHKKDMTAWADQARLRSLTIGFVPTMGALHEGHLALVTRAASLCDKVVVSIFVNPTQFGPGEDFDAYPRDLDGDLEKLAELGVDMVFAPTAAEMYQGGLTTVHVDGLTAPLCGAKRPGHFDGVTTIVTKLLNIVKPHVAVFGQKDYQQLATIRKMVTDLDMDCNIVGEPTYREHDGLAMSSRNSYLTPTERAAAPIIHASLSKAVHLALQYTPGEVETKTALSIGQSGGRVDYVSCLDAETLTPVSDFSRPVVLAAAVFFGKTRLIDNIVIDINHP